MPNAAAAIGCFIPMRPSDYSNLLNNQIDIIFLIHSEIAWMVVHVLLSIYLTGYKYVHEKDSLKMLNNNFLSAKT